MAKNHKNQQIEGKETVEMFQELDQNVVQSERFIEKNAKKIGLAFAFVVALVLGYFGYQQFVVLPKNEEATKMYLTAQKNLAEGREDIALGKTANSGFKGAIEKYAGTDAGRLSAYNAGLIEFNKGNYQKAYDLLDKFSSNNKVLTALKYGVMGDCMANLNKPEDALSLFEKAISTSDDVYTSYYFTRKAGVFALATKKKEVAKKHFNTIEEKYQEYDRGLSSAYIEMLKY
ncbi:MAG: tetratricopeptide repeat protein [Flavobacteriaceae bacterium]|nr:tetratricopeptide repeat protein [Flavobacteriaceae bacterium]